MLLLLSGCLSAQTLSDVKIEGKKMSNLIQEKFSKSADIKIVQKENNNFKEYYEIIIQQSFNHGRSQRKFDQRIFLGFQDFNALTVIDTDGYAIGYASKPDYSHELAKKLEANLVLVEHRFYGKSVQNDSIDWNNLTMKQAAEDYHFIKTMLDTILTGKWVSTGISKGGQAALSYRISYPADVAATLVYGTAVKNARSITTDTLLFKLSQTDCGQKITAFQLFAFRNKKWLLPSFNEYVAENKLDFNTLDNETVFDYLLLDLPFAFWQMGHKCGPIMDTTTAVKVVELITKIVPPHFFSAKNKDRLATSFYMFYHELGYYEYSIEPFQKWLKQTNYSNKYFAPDHTEIQFDPGYQKNLIRFLETPTAETVFFIYGQNDPWALQTIAKKNVFIVAEGSHKSRINDLSSDQKLELDKRIKNCLN